MTMWELAGKPGIGSAQCVRHQFDSFLGAGPLVLYEVHTVVYVSNISLSVSCLE